MEAKKLSELTTSELEMLLENKRREENERRRKKRENYEKLKSELLVKVADKARDTASLVKELYEFVVGETTAFYDIMREYGALRSHGQRSFTLGDDNFRIEVKNNKVKRFDERADIAAERLIEFLRGWIVRNQRGEKDPMYQLAMTLLERNRYGDLDYKSVSKLYDMEQEFGSPEYSEIMQLFRESNVVESSAVNFYFSERDGMGVWRRIEPSFNRL